MTAVYWILAAVALQRLLELVYAARNTRRLKARGAVEIGANHYPLFILLHGSWLISLAILVPADTQPNWWLIAAFAVFQGLRVWVVATLGPYWTTRIITLPQAPLVRRGPFRWVRHPNYMVVICEIALLPLAFGAVELAVIYSALNLALIAYRIRIEERALAPRRTA
ncbi:MAG TPA: isoprenylcysteine carboxylmethyltransferase family protein [Stellaceae bacterium]|nr:isoprenylcysteine carboxylmethyltransferase family protein [Stellaceae bacterium]